MNISVSATRLGLLVSALMLAPGSAFAADEPAHQAKPMAGGMEGHDRMEGHDKMMPPKGKMNMGSSCMSMPDMQKMGMGKKKMDQMKHSCGADKKSAMSGHGKDKPAPMKTH